MSEETNKSFWTTLPGILTGIAAVITAIGGIIIALQAAGLIGGNTTDNVPDIEIEYFYVSPEKITSGDNTTLNWSVSDTTSVTITPEIGEVFSHGSRKVHPIENTTYTLTALNKNGASKTANVTVSVDTVVNTLKPTPTITWNNPADISYGTLLSSTQLNANASVPGTYFYTPPSGTILSAGTQTLHVDFTPTDTENYNTTSKDIAVNVLKATPTITWSKPADITYGTKISSTQFNAYASVPGTYSYIPPSETVLNAGIQTLHVDFTPMDSTNYNIASKDVTIYVKKVTPIITWNNPSNITHGTAINSTQLNAYASVPGTYYYTPPSGTKPDVGKQTLHVDFTPIDTINYNTASKDVTINVNSNLIEAFPIINNAQNYSVFLP